MVQFAALPLVTSGVVEQPVGESLKMTFDATMQTSVDLSVVVASGQRFAIVDNYPLEKGISHCNFSVSEWTSGFYVLCVKHSNGEQVIPFMLVK
jgi:hypothetical protein